MPSRAHARQSVRSWALCHSRMAVLETYAAILGAQRAQHARVAHETHAALQARQFPNRQHACYIPPPTESSTHQNGSAGAQTDLELPHSCAAALSNEGVPLWCNMLRHELGLGTWEGTPLSMSSFPCSLVGVPKLRPVWAVPSRFDEHPQYSHACCGGCVPSCLQHNMLLGSWAAWAGVLTCRRATDRCTLSRLKASGTLHDAKARSLTGLSVSLWWGQETGEYSSQTWSVREATCRRHQAPQ